MMEKRSYEIREVKQDERTVVGLAVPYNSDGQAGSYVERFESGAIDSIDGVKLFYNHAEPIGKVVRGTETKDGYEIEAVISKTTRGDEAWTLVRDGVIDKFSVGFVPVDERTEDGVVVRTKVNLKEVSLVPFPAYEGAQLSEFRSESNQTKEDSQESQTMEVTTYDDSEIRSGLETLEREFAVLKANGGNEAPSTQFRSAGEFIKALADNDENARNEVRAYTGAVLADSHTSNDWKNDLLVIVDKGRPVLNLFSRGALGSQGNSVEYPKVSATTGDVAVQAAEGDNLSYLEVGITTATAPVKTYGGYSELSRQAIERSDVSYLDTVLKFQAASYAKVTNAAVRSALVAATPQTGTSFTLSSATASSFIGAAVDGIQKIEDNGLGANAEFILVSVDVYQKLATLVDGSNRPVFNINGDGSNTVGNINVRGIAGSLAGIPVIVDAGLSAKTFYVASSDAVMTWEQAGAPVRMNDENIINLTKQFSLYGYMAVGVKNANALVKATVA